MNVHQEHISQAELMKKFRKGQRFRDLLQLYADDYFDAGAGYTDREAAAMLEVERCATSIGSMINWGLIAPIRGSKPRRCRLQSRGLSLLIKMREVRT